MLAEWSAQRPVTRYVSNMSEWYKVLRHSIVVAHCVRCSPISHGHQNGVGTATRREQLTAEFSNLTDYHKFTSTIFRHFHTFEKSRLTLQNIHIFSCHKNCG